MMIQVDGLTPPCVPATEICDGIDNDCNGVGDNADPDLTGIGAACTCDGVGMTCTDGAQAGECQSGHTVCVSAEIQCQSIGAPSAEVCDGLDNNCNGVVDDNLTDVGGACDGPDADFCDEGVDACVGGIIVCSDNTGAETEICNGFDDDCDNFTDELAIDAGGPCGSNLGECSQGINVCVAGILECQGETGPTAETCDGLDNDCTGIPDDNLTDVMQTCGDSDIGECNFGLTVCNMGTLECAGEVGPTPELCDGLDNDCDSVADNLTIDTGQPCTEPGLCTPGIVVCTPTGPECQGGTPGSPEVCNGLDDDCNNLVDDNPAGVGDACGLGMCTGTQVCSNGALECVGGMSGTTETCNGIDDDCDDVIDEGDLCEGGECQMGQCSSPCLVGEFPCPVGQICNADSFCVNDLCFDVTCQPEEACQAGACVPVCDTITCPNELVCRSRDGVCVPDTCHYLENCSDTEICYDDECIPNPCLDVVCPTDQFCREGVCVQSCGDTVCDRDQECNDGMCQQTGCAIGCTNGQVCGSDGECIDDPCDVDNCRPGRACEPTTGDCVLDPCIGVICPDGQQCDFGDCVTPTIPEEDRRYVTPGGSGCATVGANASTGGLVIVLITLGLVSGRRRMRRRRFAIARAAGMYVSLALVSTAALMSLSSCGLSGYCINCDIDYGDAGAADGGMNTGAPTDMCSMGIIEPEICDGIDNDCDDRTDEGFDLNNDIINCGACGGECILTGASSSCVQGACQFNECFPGNWDADDDTDGPYDASNGCEYSCFTTNDGVEACDNLDNDCDGTMDEGFDLVSDNLNCGACGTVCSLFQATSLCVSGTCELTGCSGGFIDLDMNPVNGCEYACAQTGGGVEACDLVDNDCDGLIDEDTDFMNDVQNCGSCGNACEVFNASPTCTSGSCVFDPMADCDANYYDINNNPIDGCEYACTPTGAEICDQLDNDCNGIIDDNPIGVGGLCNAAPGGVFRHHGHRRFGRVHGWRADL